MHAWEVLKKLIAFRYNASDDLMVDFVYSYFCNKKRKNCWKKS